jgi:hypothetical protein
MLIMALSTQPYLESVNVPAIEVHDRSVENLELCSWVLFGDGTVSDIKHLGGLPVMLVLMTA